MNAAQMSDPLHCQRLRDALGDMGVQWQVREASPTLQRILPRSPVCACSFGNPTSVRCLPPVRK